MARRAKIMYASIHLYVLPTLLNYCHVQKDVSTQDYCSRDVGGTRYKQKPSPVCLALLLGEKERSEETALLYCWYVCT